MRYFYALYDPHGISKNLEDWRARDTASTSLHAFNKQYKANDWVNQINNTSSDRGEIAMYCNYLWVSFLRRWHPGITVIVHTEE